jgi:hypothetical protein
MKRTVSPDLYGAALGEIFRCIATSMGRRLVFGGGRLGGLRDLRCRVAWSSSSPPEIFLAERDHLRSCQIVRVAARRV